MVYKPRYLRLGLHITMLALVTKFTRMEENERHLVQIFGEMPINFARNSGGEARLAAHLR